MDKKVAFLSLRLFLSESYEISLTGDLHFSFFFLIKNYILEKLNEKNLVIHTSLNAQMKQAP